MKSTNYRADIDGMRAIAVLAVLAFHLKYPWARGGYLGVDVFFVISGYLITNSILSAHADNTFDLRRFWVKRIKRLGPSLLTVVLAVLTYQILLCYKPLTPGVCTQSLAAIGCYSNLLYWDIANNYWGDTADQMALLHTWSLSLEEQFYLLYPIAIAGFLKRGYRSTWIAIACLALASLGAYLYALNQHPAAGFYLLPFRGWQIGLGALCSPALLNTIVAHKRPPQLKGLGVLVISASMITSNTQGVESIATAIGTAMALSCNRSGFTNQLLSRKPIVYIGRISYSLYLWHWPVIVLTSPSEVGPLSGTSHHTTLLILTGLSILSYHCIEQPLRHNPKTPQKALFLAAASTILIAIGTLRNNTYNTNEFSRPKYLGYCANPNGFYSVLNKSRGDEIRALPRFSHTDLSPRAPSVIKLEDVNGRLSITEKKKYEIIVLGDSHGGMWAPAIQEACNELEIPVGHLSMHAIPLFFDPARINPHATSGLNQQQMADIRTSIIEYINYAEPRIAIIGSLWSNVSAQDAAPLITWLTKNKVSTILIEDPPQLNIPDQVGVPPWLAFRGLYPIEDAVQFAAVLNQELTEAGSNTLAAIAEGSPTSIIARTQDLYLSGVKCLLITGSRPIYHDRNHLTHTGSLLSKNRIKRAIKTALDNPGQQ